MGFMLRYGGFAYWFQNFVVEQMISEKALLCFVGPSWLRYRYNAPAIPIFRYFAIVSLH